MDKRQILLITKDAHSFLLKALIKSLNGGGFDVVPINPNAEEIMYLKRNDNLPPIFIVYLEDYEDKYDTLFPCLEKLVSEPNITRHLYLVGNSIEISAAYKFIPKNLVAYAFERPVNSMEMIKQIQLLSAGYSYEYTPENLVKSEHLDPKKHTLLLVDDDSTYLKAMERWFTKEFNVFAVNSGMNAVSLLKRRTVELILLDYEMPVLSGLEVFQIMRSEPSTAHIPIIFLTSKDDKKTVMEVLQAGPDAYLLKTKPPAILVQNIKDFFAEKEKKNANNADENAALEGDGEEKAEYKSDLPGTDIPSSDLPKSDIPASDIPQSDLPKDE